MSLRFSNLNVGAIGLLLLSGCTASGGIALFPAGGASEKAPPAVPPEADTCPTPEKCAEQLRKMIKDPKRDWIGQPQSQDAYADGTRLFAYRALRKKLTCNELKRAFEDADAATSSMQQARYGHVRALTAAVARELKAEQDKRCRSRP
jgi:hypothetical protein